MKIEIKNVENGFYLKKISQKGKTEFVFKTIKECEEFLGQQIQNTKEVFLKLT